ncbi:ABC transporter substrate-binding protein [Alkalibacillus haloalkaliphilus]|uniref:ABC transporter substrate-binding protein n=1 Tax=Alkalibacillus haloalkaliphilus TaxID=94136 RepID=UPI000312ED57|nr:ABC transporter substrate-binding protein [Alkalibacillus haloalkaliphilus]
MQIKKWGFVFIIGVVLIMLSACGTGATEAGGEETSSDEQQVLEMGTSADFPPFESFNEDGEFVGFDIDLAHKIAEELGYELEISDMNFDGLIGALQSDRVDMVLAGMSATEERQENVDFSPAYHHSGEMFITQEDSDITSIEDIEGKTVGVQLGTIQEEGAQALQADYDFEIHAVDEATNIIQDLLTNRIDVGYIDTTVAEGYIEEQGLAGFVDPTESSPGMAIAFPKDSELQEDISAVIEQFLEDGTIAELEEKWELDEQ